MADYPALPLFTDAYLADAGHLTFEEHGAYLRLLMLMWRSPQCRVPNDATWIQRKLHCSEADYERLLAPILKEFCKSSGNWISQKRLKREFEFVKKTSKTQSARAKSRWNNKKPSCPADAGAMPRVASTRHRSGNAPTPTPTPTPLKKNPPIGSPPADPKGTRLPDDWQPNAEERAYAEERGLDPDRTAMDFRGHWVPKTGKDARKLRWDLTWQTWCRRQVDFQAERGGNGAGQGDLALVDPDVEERAQWRARVSQYEQFRENWRNLLRGDWGPPPDEPGCRAPPEILREFGYGKGST